MTSFIAFALLAAAPAGGPAAMPAFTPTKAVAAAQAFVRILPGARISLSAAAQPEGYAAKAALVTVEDGTKHQAKLVEFQ